MASPTRWLVFLAGALVWTSADGQRHVPREPHRPQRAVARRPAPPRPRAEPAVEFCYPADPPIQPIDR